MGYAVVRRLDAPYTGIRLGPWVAIDDEAAVALLRAITADSAPWGAGMSHAIDEQPQLFASIPGTNKRAMRLFESCGGMLEEDDLIMRLDLTASESARDADVDSARGTPLPDSHAAHDTEHPNWLYGWIAPMVF